MAVNYGIPFGPTMRPGHAVNGLSFFDDFIGTSLSTTDDAATWDVVIDSGATVVIANDEPSGVITLTPSGGSAQEDEPTEDQTMRHLPRIRAIVGMLLVSPLLLAATTLGQTEPGGEFGDRSRWPELAGLGGRMLVRGRRGQRLEKRLPAGRREPR